MGLRLTSAIVCATSASALWLAMLSGSVARAQTAVEAALLLSPTTAPSAGADTLVAALNGAFDQLAMSHLAPNPVFPSAVDPTIDAPAVEAAPDAEGSVDSRPPVPASPCLPVE
jgi:hypothetical protein